MWTITELKPTAAMVTCTRSIEPNFWHRYMGRFPQERENQSLLRMFPLATCPMLPWQHSCAPVDDPHIHAHKWVTKKDSLFSHWQSEARSSAAHTSSGQTHEFGKVSCFSKPTHTITFWSRSMNRTSFGSVSPSVYKGPFSNEWDHSTLCTLNFFSKNKREIW